MDYTQEILHDIYRSLSEIVRNNSKTQVKLADDTLMTNEEFEGFMKISSTTSYKWRLEGIITFYQIGGKIYYKVKDVNIMLAENYFPSKNEKIRVNNNLKK
jgi:hypothetical protein